MNSQTPMTDAIPLIMFRQGSVALENCTKLRDLSRRLERERAELAADKAALIAAVRTYQAEFATLAARLSPQYRANVQACMDHAAALLKRMEG